MDLASGLSGSPTVSTRVTPQVLPVMLVSFPCGYRVFDGRPRVQNSGPSTEDSVEIEDMACVERGCSFRRVSTCSSSPPCARGQPLIINNAEAKIRFLDRGTSDLDSQTSSTVASWVRKAETSTRVSYDIRIRRG